MTLSGPSAGYTLGTSSVTFGVLDDDSGVSYDTDAQALFAKMIVQPTAAKKLAISDFIAGLKTDNLWTRINGFIHGKLHDKQAALLNWVPGAPDFQEAGTAGGGVHTPGVGFTPDGTATLSSRTVSAGKTQDQAGVSIRNLNGYGGNMLGSDTVRLQAGASGCTISATLSAKGTGAPGRHSLSRSSASTYGYYRDGVFIESVNRASVTPAGFIQFGSTSTSSFQFDECILHDNMSAAQLVQMGARLDTLSAALAA